jgi:hypothetical protein
MVCSHTGSETRLKSEFETRPDWVLGLDKTLRSNRNSFNLKGTHAFARMQFGVQKFETCPVWGGKALPFSAI